MPADTIDTLGIFDRLKKSFTDDQAHLISEIIKDVHEDNLKMLATKADLKHELKELELHLTIRMGVIMASAVAVLTAIIKLTVH